MNRRTIIINIKDVNCMLILLCIMLFFKVCSVLFTYLVRKTKGSPDDLKGKKKKLSKHKNDPSLEYPTSDPDIKNNPQS